MKKLSPSILAADFSKLSEEIQKVENANVEYLHIDVMDGMFVPSISFGVPIIQAIRKNHNMIFDVHLMIEEPERYIDDFVEAGADLITVHVEACTHLHSTIMKIKNAGVKASVALNPSTPLSVLEYVLEDLDMVLIMSVNPGFGGQKFIPSSLRKIRELKALINAKNLNTDIQVDGGVNLENVSEIAAAGANIIVAGTAVFRGDVTQNVEEFHKIFQEVN